MLHSVYGMAITSLNLFQSAGKQPTQPRSIEQTDIEFDSALFEPTNNESDEGVSYFYIFSKL